MGAKMRSIVSLLYKLGGNPILILFVADIFQAIYTGLICNYFQVWRFVKSAEIDQETLQCIVLSRRDHVAGTWKMHDDLTELRVLTTDRDLLHR